MSKRSYHQFCRVAKALDVVGERWTLLIARDLLLGPRRYADLLAGLPGLTTNLLAQRLKDLTDAGILERQTLPPPGATRVYALTELGQTLRPVVLALGAFGAQLPLWPDPDDHVDARWAMVSLMRRYRGCPRRWTVELQVDDRVFQGQLGPDQLDMRDGRSWTPDLVLRGARDGFVRWLFRGESARALVAAGTLERVGGAKPLGDLARSIGARP